MASIYKRKQDKNNKRTCWYIGYTDHNGKRKTSKGFSDKKETERLAAKLEHDVMLRKKGIIDPEQEIQAEKRNASLIEHLEAFEKTLSMVTVRHRQKTMYRIRRIIDDADMETPTDIKIESVEMVLQGMLKDDEIGHKTYNHYVSSMQQFCNWMVPKRMLQNPLSGIKKLNTEVDIRHKRRALTPDEFQKLVQSARTSEISIQCYSGEERARIYTISYMTGLRRKEIASLTPRSFNLTDNPPTLTVEAACSKHRRKDVLPLHQGLVTLLKEWLTGDPDDPLFPKLAKRYTSKMVRMDLERAGIPYETVEGIADFHASGRHTHITELLRNGTSIPEAMKLARHSDVKMTMKYTHIGIEDQHEAVQNLPWECPGSASETSNGHCTSQNDTKEAKPPNDETPVGDRGYHQISSSDKTCQKYERGDSNPHALWALDPKSSASANSATLADVILECNLYDTISALSNMERLVDMLGCL